MANTLSLDQESKVHSILAKLSISVHPRRFTVSYRQRLHCPLLGTLSNLRASARKLERVLRKRGVSHVSRNRFSFWPTIRYTHKREVGFLFFSRVRNRVLSKVDPTKDARISERRKDTSCFRNFRQNEIRENGLTSLGTTYARFTENIQRNS